MSSRGLMFCQMKAGTLNTKKLDLPLNSPVSKLFSEAASFSASSEERLELSYQGKILRQGKTLEEYEVSEGGLIMVTEIAAPKTALKPEPAQLSNEEIRKFGVAFKTAMKTPSFSVVVKRLLERDNMDSLAAACPGLSDDVVAQSFLTRPDLLAQLCGDPETLTNLARSRPALLEAANNLAAAVHEEQQSLGRSRAASQSEAAAGSSGGAGGGAGGGGGGSYYLDEMSDDEMETEEGQQGGGRAIRASAGGGITPAQLAQALAMAAGMGGGGGSFSPFQGVTGLGVGSAQRREEGRSQSQSQATTPASASSRITTNMFQEAMQQALMASQAGQAQPSEETQGSADSDLASKVERMREMGIVDEGLALQALQIMGGDLQAAVDLIFSGWEGGDQAMS